MAERDDSRGRCDGRETDGVLEIYDVENEDAWIRSDTTVHLSWQT